MRLLDPVKISVTRWTVKFKTLRVRTIPTGSYFVCRLSAMQAGSSGTVVGGRTLPLRRADAPQGRPADLHRRLRCLPPPPPPPRGFYWLQHQQLMRKDDSHPSSTSSTSPDRRGCAAPSYATATLPAPDSRDQRDGSGRAATSSGSHSSAADSDWTPRVYQISPGATTASSPLGATHEAVV